MNERTISVIKYAIRPILFCSMLLILAHPSRAQAGCGATSGGASQYDQSACGNVAPFPAPVNGTPVSSCETLTPGTYTLTQNLTTDPTAICLTFQGTVVLDFAGYTITGRIMAYEVDPSGMHLYSSAAGGGLTCSDDSLTHPGCVYIYGDAHPISAPLEIDHLSLNNSDSSSMNSARNLVIEWGPTSSTLGRGFGVKIHNVTGTSATGPSSIRIGVIWIEGALNVELRNNKLTCQSTANACTSVTLWQINDAKIHDNLFINQASNVTGDSARAVICDGGTQGCEGYNNYFDVQDGRAWRLRGVNSSYDVVAFHDNLIDHINRGSNPDYVAAIHVCDNATPENGSSYVFQDNTLNIESGTGLMSRDCTGYPKFQNNTINCQGICSGELARIRTPVLSGDVSTFQLTNNQPVNLTSNPQVYAEIGANENVCNTGAVGGPGIIQYLSCSTTSAPSIDFASGFTPTRMVFNGNAKLNGMALRLTDGGGYETASAWFNTPVNIQTFTTYFSFSILPGTIPMADGFTFALQETSASAVGPLGGGLGYGPDAPPGTYGGIPNSVAVKFDLFSNGDEGVDSTGLYVNGASPTTPFTDMTGTGIDLHSGHQFKAHIVYDGTNLTITITDASTNASFTHTWPINIPSTVGGNTAYVGFTGGTGGLTAIQDILTWTFSN
jgi:hypothetical protein